jgi:hypothetical protein
MQLKHSDAAIIPLLIQLFIYEHACGTLSRFICRVVAPTVAAVGRFVRFRSLGSCSSCKPNTSGIPVVVDIWYRCARRPRLLGRGDRDVLPVLRAMLYFHDQTDGATAVSLHDAKHFLSHICSWQVAWLYYGSWWLLREASTEKKSLGC